jgi:hypothetical protein
MQQPEASASLSFIQLVLLWPYLRVAHNMETLFEIGIVHNLGHVDRSDVLDILYGSRDLDRSHENPTCLVLHREIFLVEVMAYRFAEALKL